MEYIIGYGAVGAIILSAYYGNLRRQKALKKSCGVFYRVYLEFINKFYKSPMLLTVAVDEDGKALPLENQPTLLQELLLSNAKLGDITDYYNNLNDAFENLRKLVGKSTKNNKHYLYPLFEILNVAAALCASVNDYNVLSDPAFVNNLNIFLNNQDKIMQILHERILPEDKI